MQSQTQITWAAGFAGVSNKPREKPRPTPDKSPKVLAPWRKFKEMNKPKPGSADDSQSEDIYEFAGFPDDPAGARRGEEASPRTTRGQSREQHRSEERAGAGKMFLVARHGAYSGLATGIKRKLEQSPSKSQVTNLTKNKIR